MAADIFLYNGFGFRSRYPPDILDVRVLKNGLVTGIETQPVSENLAGAVRIKTNAGVRSIVHT